MRFKQIGATDLSVSCVGVGCNNFGYERLANLDLAETRAVVDAALDVGINFFDTADSYGSGESERLLGEVFEGRRDRVVLATKFGNPVPDLTEEDNGARGTRAYIRRSIEGQLRRLRTDYIDLYYYHRPDGVTPVAETLAAMGELVADGMVRYIACSNVTAEMLEDAEAVAAAASDQPRFVAVQNEYNLLKRGAEDDVIPLCRRREIGFVPFYPLANGLLTGKYQRGQPAPPGSRLENRASTLEDDVFDQIDAFQAYAGARGHTLLELAIAALTAEPAVPSVIAGATSPDQVRANAAAAAWELSDSDVAELRRISAVAPA